MNKAILTGRLGKDPAVKTLTSGSTVANFNLAVQRPFKDRNGEKDTDWLPIVVWGTQAENCNLYLHKGSKVAVTGRIQTRTYQKADGTTAYITEIVAEDIEYLDSRERAESPQEDTLQGFYEVEEGLPF